MDPEDVLDFGEDDDGLDVISLGGTDHNGLPVSNRSGSSLPDYVSSDSRGTPRLRPISPSRTRQLTSPQPQRNGSRISRRLSTFRDEDPPFGRRNHPASHSNHPTPNAGRPLRGASSRQSNRSSLAETSSTRLQSDRPKPGERASYMPPDRVQALSHSSRTSDLVNSKNEPRRPVPSLSTRITDYRRVDAKTETHSSLSKLIHKPVKLEVTAEIEEPISGSKKELKKPAPSSPVNSSTEKLPEGWISRMSKGGKVYYVNVFTRTSKWARPTEPAIDKQVKPTGKLSQIASKSSGAQTIPAETSEIHTDQKTQADVQKPDFTVLSEGSSVVSRSQKQVPDPQPTSRSLGESENLRPSSKAVSHPDPLSTKPSHHHHASSNSVERLNRQPRLTGSGSAQHVGHDIDNRIIPQEVPKSKTSDSYPKGPSIHPDRRQEIAAASLDPPSSSNNIREYHRRGEFVRQPQEPEPFHSRANVPPRSVSSDLRHVSSHRPLDRHPREPPQLSGANGIPKAPGRSFPNLSTSLRSSKDFNANPDSPRYHTSVLSPCTPAKEPAGYRNVDWWRGLPDDSLNRNIPSQDRIPAQWPSRLPSPTHPSHRHRLSSRAKSPSPPPRHMSTYPDFQRGQLQPDLRRSERSRPLPAPNRILQGDRPPKPPQSSDLMPRNTVSRYDTYRPSSSSPMTTNGLRLQNSRRGDAFSSRDQGLRHIDHNEVETRRSTVKSSSVLPDLPKASPALAQPDFYRPSPRSVVAPRLSPRYAQPLKDDLFIDLDGIMSKDESLLKPLTEKNSNNLPSESVSQENPSTETSHSSALRDLDRAEGFDASESFQNDVKPFTKVTSEPQTLIAPVANEAKETCDSICEIKNASGKSIEAEVVIISSPPTAVSPKQPVPLAKRLGPVAAYSSKSAQLTPPTKKQRRNPVDKSQVLHKSDVLSDSTQVSSLEEEKKPGKNTNPDPGVATEKTKSQSESAEQPNRTDGFPEVSNPPAQISQDKVISLRGRAARQPDQVAVGEPPGPKVESKFTSEFTTTGGGSLRDRIQDLNIPSERSMRSSYPGSSNYTPQNSVVTPAHDRTQVRPGIEDGLPPPPRHISERISGFPVPVGYSPPSTGNYRSPRYTPRQSDSGWSGRRAKYP